MADFDEIEPNGGGLIAYTVEIVTAHLANNSVALADVPSFIQNVHGALVGLTAPAEPEEAAVVPIIDPRKSVKPDYLICLECGKKCKTLKAHIRGVHGLDFDDYREKYDLPASYPSIAPNFKLDMRDRAIKLGLGDKMRQARNKVRKSQGKPPIRHKPPLKAVGTGSK